MNKSKKNFNCLPGNALPFSSFIIESDISQVPTLNKYFNESKINKYNLLFLNYLAKPIPLDFPLLSLITL